MIVLIIYISAVTSYRVAFGVDKDLLDYYQVVIDIIAEVFFGIDMVLSFITGYLDSETGKFITNPKKIAKRYLKSWFIIDILSIFPWEEMSRLDLQLLKLLRMLRLIRMARLFKLLNEEMVNTLVMRLMSNLSMENKINISYIMKYMFKIFRLLLLGIGITYIIACLWYIFIYNTEEEDTPSFYKLIDVPENSNFRK